jgi:hypothetical protein
VGHLLFFLIPIAAGVIGRWKYGSTTRGLILGGSVLLGLILSLVVCAAAWHVFVSKQHHDGMWYIFWVVPPALGLGAICGVLAPVLAFRRRDSNETSG